MLLAAAPIQSANASNESDPYSRHVPNTYWTNAAHMDSFDKTYGNIPDTSKVHSDHSSNFSKVQNDTAPDNRYHIVPPFFCTRLFSPFHSNPDKRLPSPSHRHYH